MPGLFVYHLQPPLSAFLRAWGRTDGWWGLIVSEQQVRFDGGVQPVP